MPASTSTPNTSAASRRLQARWKRCEGQVDRYLGEALGQEFVARNFSPDTKQKVVVMTEQIEQAMQQEIENLDWMSPATKQAAIAKLHVVHNKIGYPDKWRDYSSLTIERNDYFGNVAARPYLRTTSATGPKSASRSTATSGS